MKKMQKKEIQQSSRIDGSVRSFMDAEYKRTKRR